jgi:ribosomal protein S12 methylthiotransferase
LSHPPKKTVHFVSLGCPKNRVDSEVMLGHLVADGYEPVESAEGADVIVVNTCGFIDSATEESLDTILEMAKVKEEGKARKLVVTGCLSQRYAPDLHAEIPEVDHFLGTGNFESIVGVLRGDEPHGHRRLPVLGQGHGQAREKARAKGGSRAGKQLPYRHQAPGGIEIPDPDFTITAASPRVSTLPGHMAYVKVSEGCSNTCAFCVIPRLRGAQRSRPISDVVAEVERLLAGGCVEVNLIAQDLCAFGKDREPKEDLAHLLRALDDLGRGRDYWIRCLYAYPKGLTQEVMDVMAGATHVLPYLDMPLQHIADPILRRMRRGKGGPATWELVRRLRESVPGLVLRTTFITGLPGETDADFAELCDFVREIRFERMGVFTYSREEDTPAGEMTDQVAAEVAATRRDELMALQKEISREQQEALVGTTVEVLVEGVAEESELLLQGRTRGQAPEIDGLTYVTEGTASPGQVVQVRIDQAGEYDLAGAIVAGA